MFVTPWSEGFWIGDVDVSAAGEGSLVLVLCPLPFHHNNCSHQDENVIEMLAH